MLAKGGCIGYWQGEIPKVLDDIAACRPTLFCGVPRVYDRIYAGINEKVRGAVGRGCCLPAPGQADESVERGRGAARADATHEHAHARARARTRPADGGQPHQAPRVLVCHGAQEGVHDGGLAPRQGAARRGAAVLSPPAACGSPLGATGQSPPCGMGGRPSHPRSPPPRPPPVPRRPRPRPSRTCWCSTPSASASAAACASSCQARRRCRPRCRSSSRSRCARPCCRRVGRRGARGAGRALPPPPALQ